MATRWRPDTCKCQVVYDYDAKKERKSGTRDGGFTLLTIENKCQLHNLVPFDQFLQTLFDHNRATNLILNRTQEEA